LFGEQIKIAFVLGPISFSNSSIDGSAKLSSMEDEIGLTVISAAPAKLE
jgi:hypothetical protein